MANWKNAGRIQGEKGEQGERGERGEQGERGEKGEPSNLELKFGLGKAEYVRKDRLRLDVTFSGGFTGNPEIVATPTGGGAGKYEKVYTSDITKTKASVWVVSSPGYEFTEDDTIDVRWIAIAEG